MSLCSIQAAEYVASNDLSPSSAMAVARSKCAPGDMTDIFDLGYEFETIDPVNDATSQIANWSPSNLDSVRNGPKFYELPPVRFPFRGAGSAQSRREWC